MSRGEGTKGPACASHRLRWAGVALMIACTTPAAAQPLLREAHHLAALNGGIGYGEGLVLKVDATYVAPAWVIQGRGNLVLFLITGGFKEEAVRSDCGCSRT